MPKRQGLLQPAYEVKIKNNHRNCRQDVPVRIAQPVVAIHVRSAGNPAVVQIAATKELPDPISP